MRKAILFLVSLTLVISWASISYAGTKALMDKLCTVCHKLDRPFSKKKTKADWEATVSRMAGRNKEITEEYKTQIIDFLSKVRNPDSVVHTAQDPNNLTDIEKLHLPVINGPVSVKAHSKAKFSVQVGEKLHPMTDEHYIYAVDLYVGNWWTDMIELSPGQEPKVEFEPVIHTTSPMEAVVHCTVDGDWSFKTEIKTEGE